MGTSNGACLDCHRASICAGLVCRGFGQLGEDVDDGRLQLFLRRVGRHRGLDSSESGLDGPRKEPGLHLGKVDETGMGVS